MTGYQDIKTVVREYHAALEAATPDEVVDVLRMYTADDYRWRSVYPFRELNSAESVAGTFWRPLKSAVTRMQRREDIFIAGTNEFGDDRWVMSMGNFMGLYDHAWLDIPPTHRIVNIRYAEFNEVVDGKIQQTGLFIDLIGLMLQAGVYPLPPMTGVYYNYPGPRYHDGLQWGENDPTEGKATLDLVNRMVDDLSALNESGSMGCPPEVLERTWSPDMLWYGPAGVGATYTIPRYQHQHQLPFRAHLTDKKFVGHVCRFAEGNFACFFGWPNLSNTPIGGWLGLPGGNVNAEMQVVDVYRREGDKLAENWVLIDLPYWLKQQGLDVFERMRELYGIS
jgi:hypothetical protein